MQALSEDRFPFEEAIIVPLKTSRVEGASGVGVAEADASSCFDVHIFCFLLPRVFGGSIFRK